MKMPLKAHRRGKGKAHAFLVALVGHQGDECVPWPFCRDQYGRGSFGHLRKGHMAHRFMCELAHGKPPTPGHVAAHSCGKGHEACVNPNHLSWKTQAENLEDCRIHGTLIRHHGGNVRRLTPEQIQTIKASKGIKTKLQLGAEFGVSMGTIGDIWNGRSHTAPQKIKHWTPKERETIRAALAAGKKPRHIAPLVGRSAGAVSNYISRTNIRPS